MTEKDSSGKWYVEAPTGGGESVRLTLVPAAEAGYGKDSIRVQIHNARGLQRGPEIPLNSLGELASGLVELLLMKTTPPA